MDSTVKRLRFKLTLDVDVSLTRGQIYRILDEHLDALITKGAGVSMYKYELPRRQEIAEYENAIRE